MGNKVTTGKPKIAGAIYRAPLGTILPTDATSSLNEAFVSQGYISEDGVNLSNKSAKDVVKAWGGDIVLTNQTDKGYSFKFTLIEHLNEDVLKTVYGEKNVKSTENQIEVDATGDTEGTSAWVIERVTKDGKADRIVIPEADITEVGEVNFNDTNAVSYPLTITSISKIGKYYKEYIEK